MKIMIFQTMLETKRTKGIIKLGANSNNEMIMSHKQGEIILVRNHRGIINKYLFLQ